MTELQIIKNHNLLNLIKSKRPDEVLAIFKGSKTKFSLDILEYCIHDPSHILLNYLTDPAIYDRFTIEAYAMAARGDLTQVSEKVLNRSMIDQINKVSKPPLYWLSLFAHDQFIEFIVRNQSNPFYFLDQLIEGYINNTCISGLESFFWVLINIGIFYSQTLYQDDTPGLEEYIKIIKKHEGFLEKIFHENLHSFNDPEYMTAAFMLTLGYIYEVNDGVNQDYYYNCSFEKIALAINKNINTGSRDNTHARKLLQYYNLFIKLMEIFCYQDESLAEIKQRFDNLNINQIILDIIHSYYSIKNKTVRDVESAGGFFVTFSRIYHCANAKFEKSEHKDLVPMYLFIMYFFEKTEIKSTKTKIWLIKIYYLFIDLINKSASDEVFQLFSKGSAEKSVKTFTKMQMFQEFNLIGFGGTAMSIAQTIPKKLVYGIETDLLKIQFVIAESFNYLSETEKSNEQRQVYKTLFNVFFQIYTANIWKKTSNVNVKVELINFYVNYIFNISYATKKEDLVKIVTDFNQNIAGPAPTYATLALSSCYFYLSQCYKDENTKSEKILTYLKEALIILLAKNEFRYPAILLLSKQIRTIYRELITYYKDTTDPEKPQRYQDLIFGEIIFMIDNAVHPFTISTSILIFLNVIQLFASPSNLRFINFFIAALKSDSQVNVEQFEGLLKLEVEGDKLESEAFQHLKNYFQKISSIKHKKIHATFSKTEAEIAKNLPISYTQPDSSSKNSKTIDAVTQENPPAKVPKIKSKDTVKKPKKFKKKTKPNESDSITDNANTQTSNMHAKDSQTKSASWINFILPAYSIESTFKLQSTKEIQKKSHAYFKELSKIQCFLEVLNKSRKENDLHTALGAAIIVSTYLRLVLEQNSNAGLFFFACNINITQNRDIMVNKAGLLPESGLNRFFDILGIVSQRLLDIYKKNGKFIFSPDDIITSLPVSSHSFKEGIQEVHSQLKFEHWLSNAKVFLDKMQLCLNRNNNFENSIDLLELQKRLQDVNFLSTMTGLIIILYERYSTLSPDQKTKLSLSDSNNLKLLRHAFAHQCETTTSLPILSEEFFNKTQDDFNYSHLAESLGAVYTTLFQAYNKQKKELSTFATLSMQFPAREQQPMQNTPTPKARKGKPLFVAEQKNVPRPTENLNLESIPHSSNLHPT